MAIMDSSYLNEKVTVKRVIYGVVEDTLYEKNIKATTTESKTLWAYVPDLGAGLGRGRDFLDSQDTIKAVVRTNSWTRMIKINDSVVYMNKEYKVTGVNITRDWTDIMAVNDAAGT